MLTKSRKQLRKEKRKVKKAKRNEYYTNRKKSTQVEKTDHEKTSKGNKSQKPQKDNQVSQNIQQSAESSRKKDLKEQAKLQKQMNSQRKKQLLSANLEEDRTIRQLEKQLKLNKRKSKAIPKSFTIDGLDYLLEVCDSENLSSSVLADQQLNEVNDEFEEDFALITKNASDLDSDEDKEVTKSDKKKAPKKKQKHLNKNSKDEFKDLDGEDQLSDLDELDIYDESDENEEMDVDNEFDNSEEQSEDEDLDEEVSDKGDLNLDSDNDSMEVNEELQEHEDNYNEEESYKSTKREDGTWEDIYGRLRNTSGEIIITDNKKYIPPAVRAKMESGNEDKQRLQKLDRLKRQLKGFLNRLAESNMHSISSQIEQLYMSNSRNDMNSTLTNLINEALVSNILAPERLLMEHVLLIVILHANVGAEVGAHFLQTMVKQFDEFLNDSSAKVENKHLDNVINIISQLYNFKIFDSKLIYEILDKLLSNFEEKHVECILHILKSVGFNLRKDNPLELKNLILNLQKKAATVSEEFKNNARLKFMLEILLAIKNNNVAKIPNYDNSYSEHLKKVLKGFIRKGNYVTQLNISLDDLLKADERGRWWVVGSAWSGNAPENTQNNSKETQESYSQKLLLLAKKQRMNTDTRRNIFCIIMSSEDYLDAFEKLLRLGLKNQQDREIIHVIIHCCLQEKKYNQFYAVLAQKFCEYDRKYQMTIKYSIWDKLKALKDHSGVQISHLAKLLSHLFIEKGLPMSILKVVQFSDLDKITLRFMRQILLSILLLEDEESCKGVFERIAVSERLKIFRESLRLFIHHFLLRNLKEDDINDDKKGLLQRRAKIIERILSGKHKTSRNDFM